MERPNFDKPKIKPFRIELDGEAVNLRPANTEVVMFRYRPNEDYVAIRRKSKEGYYWAWLFDKHPFLYWLGGFSVHEHGEHDVHSAERRLGSFALAHGWNPKVTVEDYPTDFEHDKYIEFLTADLNANDGLPEGFTAEDD